MNRKRAEYIRNKSEKEVSSGCSSYAVFFFKKSKHCVCCCQSLSHTQNIQIRIFIYGLRRSVMCLHRSQQQIISTTTIEIRRLGAFLFQFFFIYYSFPIILFVFVWIVVSTIYLAYGKKRHGNFLEVFFVCLFSSFF